MPSIPHISNLWGTAKNSEIGEIGLIQNRGRSVPAKLFEIAENSRYAKPNIPSSATNNSLQRNKMTAYLDDSLRDQSAKTNIVFSVKEKVGALAEALQVFQVGPGVE